MAHETITAPMSMEERRFLKDALDNIDWFMQHRDWLYGIMSKDYSWEKGLAFFERMERLEMTREYLRKRYVGNE